MLRLPRRLPLRPRAPEGPAHPFPHPLRRNQPPLLRPPPRTRRLHQARRSLHPRICSAPCHRLRRKAFYEEPYTAIPTNHRLQLSPESLTVGYGWDLGGRSHSLAVEAAPIPLDIPPGSEEDFITEHYWGYTKRSNGSTSAYQVKHPRWQTYKPRSYEIAVDFGLLYGPSFAFLDDQQVSSVLLAEGSAVSVHSGSHLSA
jgi:Uncharacterized conserved protein (COG2071)